MKSFIQPGNVITVTAPVGGVSSGDGVLIGSLFGVAAYDADEGDNSEIQVTGVMALPKLTTDTMAVGDPLYWDATNGHLTVTATDNVLVGVAVSTAGSGATTVEIRLNGSATI